MNRLVLVGIMAAIGAVSSINSAQENSAATVACVGLLVLASTAHSEISRLRDRLTKIEGR